jgi:hypothetical protein
LSSWDIEEAFLCPASAAVEEYDDDVEEEVVVVEEELVVVVEEEEELLVEVEEASCPAWPYLIPARDSAWK